MENGSLSASDVAMLANNDGFGNGWGGMIWLFAILALMGGGFGFGGNAAALGYENLATSNEVQRGFDNQNSMSQQRDILAAVTAGTAQSVAATNQTFHDTLGALNDKYNELARDLGNIQIAQSQAQANQNECCCNTLRAIDGVNYNNAMNTAAINENITAQTQKILDAFMGNRMADMQNEINQLKLQNQLANVVRYPNGWCYDAGKAPFCDCSTTSTPTTTG